MSGVSVLQHFEAYQKSRVSFVQVSIRSISFTMKLLEATPPRYNSLGRFDHGWLGFGHCGESRGCIVWLYRPKTL